LLGTSSDTTSFPAKDVLVNRDRLVCAPDSQVSARSIAPSMHWRATG
jgi:hypothetical protein